MLTPKTLLAALLLASAAFLSAAEKKKICFVSHLTSHGYGEHEYAAGSKLIGKWLEAAYPGQIETAYSINWPTNPAEFFKDADTVVFFCTGGDGHLVNNRVAEFDAIMKTGAGLACLHYAVEVPIGPSGKGMLDWMGGYFEKNWSVNPHWEAEFKVFPNHPVANGVKPFKMDDEWYFHMRFQGDLKNVTPILSAEAPASTMSRGDGPHSGNADVRKAVAAKEPQHVAWAYQRGEDYKNGRGFGFTGLHYHRNWMQDSFRKTVLNGVAWTAKLEIPANGIESPKPGIEELTKNIDETIGDKKQKRPLQPIKGEAPAAAAPAAGNVKPLFSSAVINEQTPGWAVPIDVELPKDSKELFLVVRDGGDGMSCDWANWAEATLLLADGSEKKLSDLNWKSASSEWGTVSKNKNAGGQDMRIKGEPVAHGIGTHANSVIAYDLPAGAKRFKARGGLDNSGADQAGSSSVQFMVFNQNPQIFLAANTSAAGGDKGNAAHDPANALAGLKINPDLEAQLFAFEPEILSPSAIDVDEKGRVWVCEVVNYRRRNGERPAGDRILILEDTDGDAKADKTTVFHQGRDIDSAHGICVLGDRVIVSAGEEIFSLYDDNKDGKSDRKELMFTKIGGSQHDHGIHAMHFGPDGRLYFNFGNAGARLCDAKGEQITDIHGVKITNQNNRPFQEGMVFRCELDGSKVEVLGWNFRNNWEIAVDSFGTVWQSDNDDDGNQGVRINYVMEYGNYGYKDELTGGGWRDARPGIEQEIPKRHWHLNDPGVVPNLLQTGAGSPTGICVYEGSLLPERFLGQPIHCDAGPNVVRAYLTKPDGAGYSAVIEDILNGSANRWFRPSDVVVAPDGSLIVADWYDPGVGGHAMGDVDRGRLFRVAPKGNNSYRTPESKDALQGLGSPNMARRYLAWQALAKNGKAAEGNLTATAFDANAKPYLRARALWLLARLDNGMDHLNKALSDPNSDIRITALRAVRYLYPAQLTPVLEKLAADANPQVRREVAVAIRYDRSNAADQIWVKLASQYDGKDRWYLEALGIAADLTWNTRFTAINTEVHDDIVWRSRAENSAALIADRLIAKPESAENVKYLRALQFQPDPAARAAAYQNLFEKGTGDAALFAAAQLGSGEIAKLPDGPKRLDAILAPVRGTAEFVSVVDRLNLRGFEADLANYIAANPSAQEATTAAQVILRSNQSKLNEITGLTDTPENRARAVAVLTALGKIGDRDTTRYLADRLGKAAPDMQREYVSALAISGNGGRELISLAEKRALPESLQFLAAAAIARSPDAGLRQAAQGKFRVPPVAGGENLPPVHDLIAMKANASAGKPAFAKAACITCHKVAGEGIDFGPDLTLIGNKLSKEAMFEAILFPNVAISHGFQGMVIQRKSGDGFSGYITGETDDEVTLRLPGGISQAFKKADIAQRKEMDMSLMPPGLAAALTAQELVDLVAYMQSLK